MIRAVVKHSYIKGPKGTARARAHVNYIQHRAGEDREKGARPFFDRDRERVLGLEVKERIDAQERYGVQMHKLILSPGVTGVDLKEYTRETMEEIGRAKGLELDWYAVVHTNTDHDHVHVVVMGKDRDGHRVRFDRDDHKHLRQVGDRYLEREHQLDRYLDRELDRLLTDRDYKPRDQRELERQLERLEYGDHEKHSKRARDAERDRREFEKLDKDLHRAFEPQERGLGGKMTKDRYIRESQGRLLDFHHDYQTSWSRQRLEQIAAKQPDRADEIARELAYIDEIDREHKQDRFSREEDLDRLIDGKHPLDRLLDKVIEQDRADMKERRDERGEDKSDRADGNDRGERRPWSIFQRGYEQEQRDDGRSFEQDRQARPEDQSRHDRDREDRDRDRGDDFGR